MNDLIPEIKACLGSVRAVLESQGITVPRDSKIRCIWHSDKSPSLHVYPDHVHCYGCGKRGDVIDLWAHFHGKSTTEAIRELTKQLDPPAPQLTPSPRTPSRIVPKLDKGTKGERYWLAGLRNVVPEAVDLAVERGLLRFATLKGWRSWVILDSTRRNLQARRLDGKTWPHIGDQKAWTLPRFEASWPIGLPESDGFRVIALVWGGPDMLAAFHFAIAEDMADMVAPVCITGDGIAIPEDALPYFGNHCVRIFHDWDESGQAAGKQRFAQLNAVPQCKADCFSLEGLRMDTREPVKDLNDLTHIDADQFEADRDLWGIMT